MHDKNENEAICHLARDAVGAAGLHPTDGQKEVAERGAGDADVVIRGDGDDEEEDVDNKDGSGGGGVQKGPG